VTVIYVQGDIFLSRAQVIVFGTNASAASESTAYAARLADRYPAALAAFRKQARAGRISPGTLWLWRESLPGLGLLVVRERGGSATRPRFVEDAAQVIARDWRRMGLEQLALTALGDALEWPGLRPVLDTWLGNSGLPVVVYETILPGIRSDEPWDSSAHN
jgi:hypothetical protein